MSKKKRNLIIISILAFIFFLGLGYSFINSSLSFKGDANVDANKWIIYFDDINFSDGNISANFDATIVDEPKQNIELDLDFTDPSQVYQFTVDTVNDGTIDAMVVDVTSDILDNELKPYLTYTVEYTDTHKEIRPCDMLYALTTYEKDNTKLNRRNITITVKTRDGITIPEDKKVSNPVFTIHYAQETTCNIDRYYSLYVDPNGGHYTDEYAVSTDSLEKLGEFKEGEHYNFGTATRNGFDLLSWTSSDGEIYLVDEDGYAYVDEEKIYTMPAQDITLTATWKPSSNFVARIEDRYYETVQAAFDAAVNDDIVYLIRDTDKMTYVEGSDTATLISSKRITFDIQGHELIGRMIIDGDLTYRSRLTDSPAEEVRNPEEGIGTIKNPNGEAILVNGTFTYGEDDGLVFIDNIAIVGEEYGVINHGTFNFYDGYIIGKTWSLNGPNRIPDEFMVFVDETSNEDDELLDKAYLVSIYNPPDVGVAKTLLPIPILYRNLQQPIRFTSFSDVNTSQTIYAIRAFEATNPIKIEENKKAVFDTVGYYIQFGYTVKNYGEFIITSSDMKNDLSPSVPMENYGVLTLNHLIVNETTSSTSIINKGELNLINTQITSKEGYSVENRENGQINIDNKSSLKSTQNYALYNNNTESELVLEDGTIYGIYNDKGIVNVNGSKVTNGVNDCAFNTLSGATTNINDTITEVTKTAICNSGTTTVNSINDRTFITTNYQIAKNSGTLIINDGYLEGNNTMYQINNSSSVVINGGYIKSSDTTIYTYPGRVEVNGGTIDSGNIAIDSIGGRITINGGLVKSRDITVKERSGTVIMNGGTIETRYDGILASCFSYDGLTCTPGVITVNDGNINATNYGIDARMGETYVFGGTIDAGVYGVRSGINSYTQIGDAEDAISITNPSLTGASYGLYIEDGNTTTKFFDGILKGRAWGYYGDISEVPDGATVYEDDYETINNKKHQVTYLIEIEDWLEYDGNTYNSLSKVSEKIYEDHGITQEMLNDRDFSITLEKADVKVIKDMKNLGDNKEDAAIRFSQQVKKFINIDLDLNGYTINVTQPIINKGTLTINDSSYLKNGELTTESPLNVITNNGTLIINSGTISKTEIGGDFKDNNQVIISNDKFIMNGGNINSSTNGIKIYGYLEINDGTFDVENTALNIYANAEGSVINNINIASNNLGIHSEGTYKINGGTINATNKGIHVRNGTLTINDLTVNAENQSAIYEDSGKVIINDGTYTGKDYGAIATYYIRNGIWYSTGSIEINGGTFTGGIYGLNNDAGYSEVYGGLLIGGTDGIYSKTKLIIGIDDNNIHLEKPIVVGEEYGLYIQSGFTSISDGMFHGHIDGYKGIIAEIPDATAIKKDQGNFEDSTYERAYVINQEYFLRAKERGSDTWTDFNSLQNAIDFINNDGIIQMTATAITKYTATIPSTKTIEFDLNDETYIETMPIINEGVLTIVDTSIDKKGAISSNSKIDMIENHGTLTIENANLLATLNPINENEVPLPIKNEYGTIIINNINIESEGQAIQSTIGKVTINNANIISKNETIKSTGELIINGGYYESQNSSTIANETNNNKTGTGEINDGTFISKNTYALYTRANFKINGGYFESEKTAIYNQGNLTITNGEISAKERGIYNSSSSTILTIDNMTINSVEEGIYANGTTTINDIYIRSSNNNGISNYGTIYINGGYIRGEVYGLYNANRSTATLGSNDGTIKRIPELVGRNFGVYNHVDADAYTKFHFYDGILKGSIGEDGYYGIVNTIADNSFIGEGTDIIDDELYVTKFLQQIDIIVHNVELDKNYMNLNEAFSEAEPGNTLELIHDALIYYDVSIPEDAEFTFDINGYELTTSKTITNYGKVTLIDSIGNADKEPGASESHIETISGVSLFNNRNELTIKDIKIDNTTTNYYLINNSGKLDIDNLTMNCRYGISSTGILNILNSDINAIYIGINSTGKLDIDGGTYATSNTSTSFNTYSIYSGGDQENTIQNAIVNSNFQTINLSQSQSMTMNNVTSTGLIRNDSSYSSMTIVDSNIKGKISNAGISSISNTSIDPDDFLMTYNYYVIKNSGTMTIDQSSLTGNTNKYNIYDSYINNTGNMSLTNNDINIFTSASSIKCINNNGQGNLIATDNIITMTGDKTIYGIYTDSKNSFMKITSGTVEVTSTDTAYGAYINYGTLQLSEQETTEEEFDTGVIENFKDINTEDPKITAIGLVKGVGVKKANGYFFFFDGRLIGSHEAKPDTTSLVELNYEAIFYNDEITGYENCIIEYKGTNYNAAMVAILNTKYYASVQDAINAAKNNDTIQIIKNVKEDVEIPSSLNVIINLNKNTFETQITNNGKLTIYNGIVTNEEDTTIINNGTLNIGNNNDDEILLKNIAVINNKDTAIIQNGSLFIYDGYVEAVNTAIDGIVTGTEENTRVHHAKYDFLDGVYLQLLDEESIRNRETNLILTINPNGGSYKDNKEVTTIYNYYGDTYELSDPIRNGYNFEGWTIVPSEVEEDNIITMGLQDVTVTANWSVDANSVAHIKDDYYYTLQDAINDSKTNDKIELIKDIEEEITNIKEIYIDLGSHTITGSIINNGTLRLDNGTIINNNGPAITNNRILRLGNNDGIVSEDSIKLIGTEIGLVQNDKFYMYDGSIEGKVALKGTYESLAQGYYFFIGVNDATGNQLAYLIGNPTNVVAATNVGGAIYYFNLQEAINASVTTGYEISITKSFDATYPLEIPENTSITINLDGYTVNTASSFINNGTLKIHDKSETPGKLNVQNPITNNEKLEINKVNVYAIGSKNTINNNKDIVLKDTVISSNSGYALNNLSTGSVSANTNVIISGTNLALNNSGTLELSNVTIKGINNLGTITLNNVDITPLKGIKGIQNNQNGTINLNGGTITADSAYAIGNECSNCIVNINGTTISNTASNTSIYKASNNVNAILNIENANIISNNAIIFDINYGKLNIKNANIKSNTGTVIHLNNAATAVIEDANIETDNAYIFNMYYGTATINDGKFVSNKSNVIISNNSGSTININGGEFKSINNNTIYMNISSTKLNIKDNAIIKSETLNAINALNGTINIGENDDEVKEIPYIEGYNYGLYNTNSTINYYDGIIKGRIVYNNDISNVATGYEIKISWDDDIESTELEKVETFNTYLSSSNPISRHAKYGDGYARITFLGNDEVGCNQLEITDIEYTGEEYEFIPTCDGNYILEVWGAAGGNAYLSGGAGGYSVGTIELSTSNSLYINVGGRGKDRINGAQNGGYNGGGSTYSSGSSGGGATHIATESGLLNELAYKKESIIIVAGGGGGTNNNSNTSTGGSGGGYIGGSANLNIGNAEQIEEFGYGTGGTQTEGGSSTVEYSWNKGKFGQGGNCTSATNGTRGCSGGGGGYYGGGASQLGGSGGGSGYLNKSVLTNAMMYGLNVPGTTLYANTNIVKGVNYLKVNNFEFNNFDEALEALGTEGTIEVIADKNVKEIINIPKNYNITLEMNGHKLELLNTITNNGTLTINDKQNKAEINNTKSTIINNLGTLTINKTKIYGNTQYLITSGANYCILTLDKVTVISDYTGTSGYAIYNSHSYSEINIKDSIIKTNYSSIQNQNGTMTIENSTISSNTGTVLSISGNTIIKNGTYKSSSNNVINQSSSTLTIEGGTFETDNSTTIFISNGVMNINGGEIISKKSALDGYNYYRSNPTVNITGGLLESKNGNAINYYYGILNIGKDDGELKDIPIIKGFNYGLNNVGGTVNFYDGYIIGTYSHLNELVKIANGYELKVSQNDELEQAELEKIETFNTQLISSNPISKYAKSGAGAARITYLGNPGVSGCSNVEIIDYVYTGSEEEFTPTCAGNYLLEVWGAQGGSYSKTGGYGGYSKGNIVLDTNDTLYINVGGTTTTLTGGYNGGGTAANQYYARGGGGATHIATVSGLLKSLEENKESVIIVAGGGGGSDKYSNGSDGGSGGGYIGGNGGTSDSSLDTYTVSTGGTLTEGGLSGKGASDNENGTFGQGGSSLNNRGGGGGGGYYGGGAGSYNSNVVGSGAGGSGYINNTLLTNAMMYGHNVPGVKLDETAELVVAKKFLKVNDVEYNSFEDALEAVGKTGTIDVIADKDVIGTIVINSDKNIIINLNGHKLTTNNKITNNGTLELKDETGTAEILNETTTMIENKGTMTIDNIKLVSPSTRTIDNSKNLTIKNVNIESNYNGYTINTSNIINIKDTTINSNHISVYNSGSTMTLENCNFYSETNYVIYNSSGTMTIKSGNYSTKNTDVIYAWAGTLNIEDGNFESYSGNVLKIANTITINITKGTFKSTTGNAIDTNGNSPTIKIYGGLFESKYNNAFRIVNGNVTVEDGYVYSNKESAIYISSGIISIGKNDETYDNTKPIIKGEYYGIYKTGGEVNFYDGTIYGKTNAIYGEYTEYMLGYESMIGREYLESNSRISKNGYALITNLNTNEKYEYTYTGSSQVFEVPSTGTYKFELYGASGGSGKYINYYLTEEGGKGSYTSGELELEKDNILYVYVGGKGIDATSVDQYEIIPGGWNGGGNGTPGGKDDQAGSGGGATDIRLVPGEWNDLESLSSRIMVAAGGGGGHAYSTTANNQLIAYPAINGLGLYYEGSIGIWSSATKNIKITQTVGGAFGYGTSQTNKDGTQGAGGGGGGYYGGIAGNNDKGGPGSGGTSFISGHAGSIAISASSDLTPRLDSEGNKCVDKTTDIECSKHYSGYVFTNTKMIDGADYEWSTEKLDIVSLPNIEIEYEKSILTPQKTVIKNDTTKEEYINVQEALTEAVNNDTLIFIEDAKISYDITNPIGKTITFNLNGKKVETTKTIINNGTMIINDEVGNGSIIGLTSKDLITNNNILNLDNVRLESLASGIYNNSSLTINNSVVHGNTNCIYNNTTLLLIINNSTIGLRSYNNNYGIRLNKDGKIDITNSSITATTAIYSGTNYNNEVTIKDNSVITGGITARFPLTIENSELNGSVSTSSTIMIKDSQFNNSLSSSGTGTITGSTFNHVNTQLINSSGKLILSNNTFNMNSSNGYNLNSSADIESTNNKYNLDSRGNYANSNVYIGGSAKFISNNDEFVMNNPTNYSSTATNSNIYINSNSEINITDAKINNNKLGYATGIYCNNGELILNNVDINVQGITYAYGIQNKSIVTLTNGTINAYGATNSYGIYNYEAGSFTVGVEDGSGTDEADVSIENPLIVSKGSNVSYGIYNKDGEIKYYDGKIGSNITPLSNLPITEYNYITTLHYDEEGKYEYVILTYQKGFEGNVATVDGKEYTDLQSAISAAHEDSTVTLLVDTNEYISNPNNITLDLNQNTLTGSIINNGELIVKNGTIENPIGPAIVNNNLIIIGNEKTVINDNETILKGKTNAIEQNNYMLFISGKLISENEPVNGNVTINPYFEYYIEEVDGLNEMKLRINSIEKENISVFEFTGNVQEFKALETGQYLIQMWGAQGNQSTSNRAQGGKGAYTEGKIELEENDILYIYVGEHRTDRTASFNAGSTGGSGSDTVNGGGVNGYGGGGATDIRLNNGQWNNSKSLASRIMVAAGGGGATDYSYPSNGGAGGALIGEKGHFGRYPTVTYSYENATGGTQISGGISSKTLYTGASGKIGQGGNGNTSWGSAGGGGYYGGAGGGYYSNYVASGAGGSSYISGYYGSVAVTSETDLTPRKDSENEKCTMDSTDPICSVHYSGKIFTESIMISGKYPIPYLNDCDDVNNGHVIISKVG